MKIVVVACRNNSIKIPEREKTGLEGGHGFRNIEADHMIPKWKNFLSNSKNKSLLTNLISDRCQNEAQREAHWKGTLCND